MKDREKDFFHKLSFAVSNKLNVSSRPVLKETFLNKALLIAGVAKLADALDLGSSGATRESSSLSVRTIFY